MVDVIESVEKPTDRTESATKLEYNLLRTSWVKEAELIKQFVPEEDLTKNQVKLLDKCINREDFTDKQLSELKLILVKYRKILQKIRPDEALDNVDTAIQMIKTEADFIALMNTEQERRLLVHIDTVGGKKEFDFEVLPINDSRVIDSLEMQIDLFRDYSLEEQKIYAKSTTGETLSQEEKDIIDKMNREILEKQSTERIKTIHSFLAHQLKLYGSNASIEERETFWELFPFYEKIAIFMRVQNMLGLSDVKNSELFPTRQ